MHEIAIYTWLFQNLRFFIKFIATCTVAVQPCVIEDTWRKALHTSWRLSHICTVSRSAIMSFQICLAMHEIAIYTWLFHNLRFFIKFIATCTVAVQPCVIEDTWRKALHTSWTLSHICTVSRSAIMSFQICLYSYAWNSYIYMAISKSRFFIKFIATCTVAVQPCVIEDTWRKALHTSWTLSHICTVSRSAIMSFQICLAMHEIAIYTWLFHNLRFFIKFIATCTVAVQPCVIEDTWRKALHTSWTLSHICTVSRSAIMSFQICLAMHEIYAPSYIYMAISQSQVFYKIHSYLYSCCTTLCNWGHVEESFTHLMNVVSYLYSLQKCNYELPNLPI